MHGKPLEYLYVIAALLLLVIFHRNFGATLPTSGRYVSSRGCESGALLLLVSGEPRTFEEDIVRRSQKINFLLPLEEAFGAGCIAAYFCTTKDAVVEESNLADFGVRAVFKYEEIDEWKLGVYDRVRVHGYTNVSRAPVHYFQQADRNFRCYEDSIAHLKRTAIDLEKSISHVMKTRPDLFWVSRFDASQLFSSHGRAVLDRRCDGGAVYGRLTEAFWVNSKPVRLYDGEPAIEERDGQVRAVDLWSIWDFNCKRHALQFVQDGDKRMMSCTSGGEKITLDPSVCVDDMLLIWTFPSRDKQNLFFSSERYLRSARDHWTTNISVDGTPCRCISHYWMWGTCDMDVRVITAPFGLARPRNSAGNLEKLFNDGNFKEVRWWTLQDSSADLFAAASHAQANRTICSVV